LALAEAMTVLPAVRGVLHDVHQRACAAFTEQQFAAIAWTITAMTAWNRLGVLGHPHSGRHQRAARRRALAISRSMSAG
jgi:alkylhydroperoxidase family enzyme